MSDLETRLTAALHADQPPARDAVFRVETLVRLEQERFRRQVRRAVAAFALLAVLAAVSAPLLNDWVTADSSRLWLVALTVSVAVCVLTAVMVQPRLRTAARTVGRLLYP